MTPQEIINVVKAFEDGKEIEFQKELTSDWKIIQRLNHTKVTIKEE